MRTQILAQPEAEGQRLDRFLRLRFPGLGQAAVRRLIGDGQVRINGRRAPGGQRLRAGDAVELELPTQSDAALPDPDVPLRIRHEDPFLICADKPAGMPSHPLRAGERGTLASGLLARYPELAGVGYSPREPGIVHRLDTDTSGLLLAARDPETFAALRRMLERGELDKRYVALCAGQPVAPAEHSAFLIARGKRVRVLEAPAAGARAIRTELLSAHPVGASFSLVGVRVHLARRHQVRAHLAALGHPIAGDALYGGAAVPGLERHFLHAAELRFTHPRTATPLHLQAPLPPDLEAVLHALG